MLTLSVLENVRRLVQCHAQAKDIAAAQLILVRHQDLGAGLENENQRVTVYAIGRGLGLTMGTGEPVGADLVPDISDDLVKHEPADQGHLLLTARRKTHQIRFRHLHQVTVASLQMKAFTPIEGIQENNEIVLVLKIKIINH